VNSLLLKTCFENFVKLNVSRLTGFPEFPNRKFEAIVESEKYDNLIVNELFSKLKSAEVDRGMTAKLEGPTDSHSFALVGGLKGKANTNPSTSMFSLSFLMSMPDEEFDVLGED
jgi:hypothetical protein